MSSSPNFLGGKKKSLVLEKNEKQPFFLQKSKPQKKNISVI